MAAENPAETEITDSYLGMLEALHAEIHEAVRILRKFERLAEPYLGANGQPVGLFAARAARRRNGGTEVQ